MSNKEYYYLKNLAKEIQERMNYLLEQQDKVKYDQHEYQIYTARYSENKRIYDSIKELLMDFQLGDDKDAI